jgi:hypothetical protein
MKDLRYLVANTEKVSLVSWFMSHDDGNQAGGSCVLSACS